MVVVPDEATPPPPGFLLFPLNRQRSMVMVELPFPDTTPPSVLLVIVESLTVRCWPATPSPILSDIRHLSTPPFPLMPPPAFCLTTESLMVIDVPEMTGDPEEFPTTTKLESVMGPA